jgi:dTDP-glucose 4,6-dehydratase
MDKKRVLLTGSGGSIATHVITHIFTNTDWDIVGIDSMVHKGLFNRNAVIFDNHPEWISRYDLIIHDLTNPLSPVVAGEIGHIDYIINMASLSDVEASIKDPVPFVQNNISLAINMLEFARKVKPKAFIQISTDEVYGPVANKNDIGVKEWGVFLPSNPYAASKAAQEMIAISYWRTYDVPVIITNTMNNFGEMQQPSKFPVMVQKWIANNEKVIIHGEKRGDKVEIGSRSYIHSRNFADALLFILQKLPAHLHTPDAVDRPDRYNIAGDLQLDNLELAKLIAKLMGKEDFEYEVVNVHTLRPGHDRHYQLDMTKLHELGWKSPLTFEESLKNTIKWQTEHKEWIA